MPQTVQGDGLDLGGRHQTSELTLAQVVNLERMSQGPVFSTAVSPLLGEDQPMS
jgi:hypothetical protein